MSPREQLHINITTSNGVLLNFEILDLDKIAQQLERNPRAILDAADNVRDTVVNEITSALRKQNS